MIIMNNSLVRIMQLLSLAGIGVSGYLYMAKLASQFFCPVGDCQTVNESIYAQIGPIPVSLAGVLYYIALILLLQGVQGKEKTLIQYILHGAMIIGFLFSLYLTAIEIWVIRAICIWCVVSFVLVILLNVLYWGVYTRNRRKMNKVERF